MASHKSNKEVPVILIGTFSFFWLQHGCNISIGENNFFRTFVILPAHFIPQGDDLTYLE